MVVAALIIGIDGWDQYTRPLVESIKQHEPTCRRVVIDNASRNMYPALPYVHRTERLCYSKAINTAATIAGQVDWYLVLSNDVLCTGPFIERLERAGNASVVGPCLKETHGFQYLEGWCVATRAAAWETLGGWDENYQVSSWEDVDLTQTAMEQGFDILHDADFPFVHLDQRQRFTLVDNYWQSEDHNVRYFAEKRRRAAE